MAGGKGRRNYKTYPEQEKWYQLINFKTVDIRWRENMSVLCWGGESILLTFEKFLLTVRKISRSPFYFCVLTCVDCTQKFGQRVWPQEFTMQVKPEQQQNCQNMRQGFPSKV